MSDKECTESSTSESSSSSSSSDTDTDCAEKSEAETDMEKDCTEKKSEIDCAVEKSESDCAVEKSKSDCETIKTQYKPKPPAPELCNVKTQTNDSKKDCETEKTDATVIKKDTKTIKKADACTQTEEIAVGESAILCTIEAETTEDKIMAWFNPIDQHWDG